MLPPTLKDHCPLLFTEAAAEPGVELAVALSAGVPVAVALDTPPTPDEAPTATLPLPVARVDVDPPFTAVDDVEPPAADSATALVTGGVIAVLVLKAVALAVAPPSWALATAPVLEPSVTAEALL